MSENRREIICALPGDIITVETSGNSFFFLFFQQKIRQPRPDFCVILFPFPLSFLKKISRCYGGSLDLNFDGDTLLPRPYYQGCLAGHRYWICAFEMIHPSIHPPPLPKPSRQHARLIDNFQSQRGSRYRFWFGSGGRSEGHIYFFLHNFHVQKVNQIGSIDIKAGSWSPMRRNDCCCNSIIG